MCDSDAKTHRTQKSGSRRTKSIFVTTWGQAALRIIRYQIKKFEKEMLTPFRLFT